jgi:prepilin-type N-terminal cleavage/methylation domain-containing protein
MPRSSRKSTLSPTSKTPFISSKIKSSLKKSTNNSKYEEQQTPIQKYLSFVSKYTKSSHTGFTLVELIVVITILSILATVGFITMSHQSSVARDGKRITEIGNLSTSSRLTATQLKRLPIPVSDALALFVDGNGL